METNEDHKMSLTEHLIELRKRIFRILIALLIGFGACYYYKDFVLDIINKTINKEIHKNRYIIYKERGKFLNFPIIFDT